MSWLAEYRNFGVVSFTDRMVKVYNRSNSFMIIDLGGGSKVQNALWAGDGVVITYLYGRRMKVRKYTSPNAFIEIA